MGLKFKTVTKITEEGVQEEPTTSETNNELSLSVRFLKISHFLEGILTEHIE